MAISDIPANTLPEPLQLALQEIIGTVGPVLEWLSWLLGGLFGLYVVYFLIRSYLDYKRINVLKRVEKDVKFLKQRSLSEEELEQLRVILSTKVGVAKKKKVGSKKSVKREVAKGSSKKKKSSKVNKRKK